MGDAKLRWKAPVKKKTRRAWTKIQEYVLAHGNKIGPFDTQLADAVQILRLVWTYGIGAVGMHETEQH